MRGIGGLVRSCACALSLLAGAGLAGAAPKASEATRRRVVLRVVEVAGGRAYLTPGAAEDVKVGDVVRLGSAKLEVVAVNGKTSVVALGKARLRPGARGFVRVQATERASFASRAVPAALAAFEGLWKQPSRPADSQNPAPVPLGAMEDPRRNRALLAVEHFRILPLSGSALSIGRTRLRARLHLELSDPTVTLDADGAFEGWQASDLDRRRGNASRPLLRLRQLELGLVGDRFAGGIGRLRYASSTLGMLDGARVSAGLGQGFSASAFGGAVPAPLDSSFSGETTRFGTELAWNASTAPARAFVSLTGSSYDGSLDERRLTASLETYPDHGHLAARTEVSLFDADNPWGASTTELTAAGLDVGLRLDALRLGASAELRRPDRSRYLAALLPPGYFCVAAPQPGLDAIESCVGGDRRHSGSLRAAWEEELWSVSASLVGTGTRRAEAEQVSGMLGASHRRLWGPLRGDVGVSVSSGSILDSAGLSVSAGGPLLGEAVDVTVHYRPRLTRYRADAFFEQEVGLRLAWTALESVDAGLSADLLEGGDVDVAYLLATLAWRPRF